jgi:alcohol dehydrogenase
MAALGHQTSDDVSSVFDAAYAFCADLGIEMKLSGLGVPSDDLDAMADDAFAIRRLLDNNPRDLARDDIRAIYQAAF